MPDDAATVVLEEDPAVPVPAEKLLLDALAAHKPVPCMFCRDEKTNLPKMIDPVLGEMECGRTRKVPAAVWECRPNPNGEAHYRRETPIRLGVALDGTNSGATITVGVGIEVKTP